MRDTGGVRHKRTQPRMPRNLQSRSFSRRKRARLWWTLGLFVVAVGSSLCALSLITWASLFAIDTVTVSGADTDIASTTQNAALHALDGSYLGLFSRSSTLIYSAQDVRAAVTAVSPRINSVSVSRSGLHGLDVTIHEKVPAAIVCATLPDFSNNLLIYDQTSGCSYADASGFLFETAPSLVSTSTDISSYHLYYAPDLSGSHATSSAEFAALQAFYDGAIAAGIAPDGILIKAGGEYELYASTTVIYINDQQPLSDELANLTAFWKHETGDFDYIDLRYGANVFYKQR